MQVPKHLTRARTPLALPKVGADFMRVITPTVKNPSGQ